MYSTTDSYKEAVNNPVLRNRVDGTITLKDGMILEIKNHEIIPGSLSINNRCIHSSSFCFGSVYVGEMNISIMKEIDRYSLYGARVELNYYLTLQDATEEKIPLGVFFVDSPKRTKRIIALKCYDKMTDFDIDVTEETVGTPYQLLTLFVSIVVLNLQTLKLKLLPCVTAHSYILSMQTGWEHIGMPYLI